MRRVSFYRRGLIWYASFFNPTTKRYTGARSTGETDKDAALLQVARWERDGIPDSRGRPRSLAAAYDVDTIVQLIRQVSLELKDTERIIAALKARELIEYAVLRDGPGAEGLIPFLLRFWNYDESPYVREKLTHRQRIGRRHCYDMALWVRTHWKPYFEGRRLAEIRKIDLKDFSAWLDREKGLQSKTINNVLAAGSVPLRWAFENEYIPTNPARGLVKFGGKSAKRGVPTEDEVRLLFSSPWSHERAYVGNMLSMSTGLRSGEVLAVQVRDIEEDRLRVRHSWSEQDRLKSTKTGEERTLPLLPEVRAAMLELARKNPNGIGPSAFVFWSTVRTDRPMKNDDLLSELKQALISMKLSEEEFRDPQRLREVAAYWKSRRVCFHSWRHYYAARMADRLEARKVMSATGHRSDAIFQEYADHAAAEVFEEVRTAATEAFGKLVPFRQ
ncbi:MAG: tyrosine-type recombinase/integrase [Spirochaetia bacterium]|jgi:integrase